MCPLRLPKLGRRLWTQASQKKAPLRSAGTFTAAAFFLSRACEKRKYTLAAAMSSQDTAVKEMKRRHFLETGLMLLDWWVACFPDRAAPAQESKIKITGVVMGNAEREEEAIASWHQGMLHPLTDRSIKYASALRRILGEEGTAYHACEYRDLSALLLTSDVEMVRDLDVASALGDRAPMKERFWSFLATMNLHARDYFDYVLITPSRTDIGENIRKHKASKAPSKPAMLRGFDTCLDDLAEKLGVAAQVEGRGGRAEEWGEAMERRDLNFREACEAKDLATLRRCFPKQAALQEAEGRGKDGLGTPKAGGGVVAAVFHADEDRFGDAEWDAVKQLCNFVGVHSSIPDKMMGRIETTAHKLAGEIAMGKADLGSLNLSEIGKSVLEGCDPSDMEEFTKNVGSLLPVLSSLQENVSQIMRDQQQQQQQQQE